MRNFKLTLVKTVADGIIVIMRNVADIERQLKQALIDSDMTRAEIARQSKLSEAQLSYFVNGKRSLTLPAAAELARVFGLELRPIKRSRKRGK